VHDFYLEEMFESFGFCDRVLKEAYWVNETSFWKPNDADRDTITRSSTIQDTEDGLSEFPHVILGKLDVEVIKRRGRARLDAAKTNRDKR
jgi:hypothetical protein